MTELKKELYNVRNKLTEIYCADKIKVKEYTEVIEIVNKALALCSSSLPLKDRRTPTFEEWTKKNVDINRYFGWYYKGEYYDDYNLFLEYEKAIKDSL